MNITANELKTKGVSAIEEGIGDAGEAVITVRGKERFIVMDMSYYNYLRECELEAALHQVQAEVKAGDFVIESVDEHLKRVLNDV
ncbi:MAG: type II toxin-antitoxin system Phd/YefM family antitoxin [Desulfobacteraceae bacterium]|jgi:hypothetical protein|nr:MAG: type II toxin-antitoxin system Phd/YefM family antitoxin [Desulfobacteraceae bacterium]